MLPIWHSNVSLNFDIIDMHTKNYLYPLANQGREWSYVQTSVSCTGSCE